MLKISKIIYPREKWRRLYKSLGKAQLKTVFIDGFNLKETEKSEKQSSKNVWIKYSSCTYDVINTACLIDHIHVQVPLELHIYIVCNLFSSPVILFLF